VSDRRVVTSPTFVLIQEYRGRLPIFHFDAYRLSRRMPKFVELGTEDTRRPRRLFNRVADRVTSRCLPRHMQITFTVTDKSTRRAKIIGFGERYIVLSNRPFIEA